MTLGCKANQFDTQVIERALTERGHVHVVSGDGCDVCIINTCAVTAESVRKSRRAVRRLRRLEPDALIAVCGCFSQLEPDAVAALGVDMLGGTGDREAFINRLEKIESKVNIDSKSILQKKTRALLKIQDGCDNYCAYCIIPYVRGHACSTPLEDIIQQAKQIGAQDHKEIVITGIEISAYGNDLIGRPSLIDAIQAVNVAAPSARIRIGSLDPAAVSGDFCDRLSMIPYLCDHFHLSLQSGCDETLRRMSRKYDTAAVNTTITRLRQSFPNCGITADLITGFPGETEAEFGRTMSFIRQAGFSGMHIFPFSPRPGTRAADMPEQNKKQAIKERAHAAAELAAQMNREFKNKQAGRTLEVLFESKKNGIWTGHSRNYLEIATEDITAKNSIHLVQITGIRNGVVWGEIQADSGRNQLTQKGG